MSTPDPVALALQPLRQPMYDLQAQEARLREEFRARTRRDPGAIGAALCSLVEQDRATIVGRGWALTSAERRRVAAKEGA